MAAQSCKDELMGYCHKGWRPNPVVTSHEEQVNKFNSRRVSGEQAAEYCSFA